ncbi:MAG: PPC domain-containing protein [Anaerolineae bacterium]|nr:PPC domain-containing protein [Anaerolineae bacterium]
MDYTETMHQETMLDDGAEPRSSAVVEENYMIVGKRWWAPAVWWGVMLLALGVGLPTGIGPIVEAAPGAQSGTYMVIGQTISGAITDDVPCEYFWFDGVAGDSITLDMQRTSGSLDGVMALYVRDGDGFSADPLAFNDDRSGGGLDPLITVTLPETDWYTVTVCRLQHEQMRVTTGTFDLTLSGPDTAPSQPVADGVDTAGGDSAAEPTEAPSLTEGLFGEPTAEGAGADAVEETQVGEAQAESTPTPIATAIPAEPSGLTDGVFEGEPEEGTSQPADADVSGGEIVTGSLPADVAVATFEMPVAAGEIVMIEWRRVSGDFSPQVMVTASDGAFITGAGTPDAVSSLRVVFVGPDDGLVSVSVLRYDGVVDETTGDFKLTAAVLETNDTVEPAPAGDNAPPGGDSASPGGDAPEAAAAPDSGYLSDPCWSALNALDGPANGRYTGNVYMAAGDGYTPDEVIATSVFATDDDLNMVLTVTSDEAMTAAAVFCSPDGDAFDAGEKPVTGGEIYLIGLDWETSGVPWTVGDWIVELYINGVLDLTLHFMVA